MDPSWNDRTFNADWSLSECLRILYQRKATLLVLTCLGILGAAAITAAQPRIYRAHASLEMRAFNENFLDLRDIYPAATPSADAVGYMQTQVEALQQDALLEQVARKLQLEGRPEYRAPEGLVARLHQDIKITPVRTSRIIQIVADARSASLASDLANTLAQAFIEQSIQDRQEAAGQTYRSLLPQLTELKRTLPPSAGKTNGAPALGADANRRLYDATLQKAYQAWFASRLDASNIQLVGPAEPPQVPYRPNLPLNLAIGTIGGLLLGAATIMMQEQRKSVLRVPGEAGTCLELPELGVIPQAIRGTPFGIFIPGSHNRRLGVDRAALEQGAGLSESFRAVVASILSGHNGEHSRMLVVTSSQPMEGKTTIVSNLGIALAAISRKVLLIDGDLRRPTLHKLFGEGNSWGLSDVLREKNAIDELPLDVLAKKTSVPHLYLLPSGASTDNIFTLLNSERMSRLFPLFRQEFDYVLVDAPPCLEFADARIMARYTEELLLVVRANYTDRRTVQTAVQRLRLDGIPLLGVILNRWNPSSGNPYSYRTSRSFIGRVSHERS